MKKLILLLSTVLLVTSCKLDEWGDGVYSLGWEVRNHTGQKLTLRCPVSEDINNDIIEYQDIELAPYDEVMIGYAKINSRKQKKEGFDYYFKKCVEKFGEDVSWLVLSEDGEILKTWKYSERHLPDQKRFFDRYEWHYPSYTWTELRSFHILPEDIVTT